MLLLATAACACDSKPVPPAPPPGPAAAASSKPRLVDTTAPGEIAESGERAFGLALPRGLIVQERHPDHTVADGTLAFEPLANFIRARVNAAQVETGPSKTIFVNAQVKDDPKRVVRVEVSSYAGRTRLVVRDRTKKPAEQGLTEAERWRRLGLTPDGRVIENKAE